MEDTEISDQINVPCWHIIEGTSANIIIIILIVVYLSSRSKKKHQTTRHDSAFLVNHLLQLSLCLLSFKVLFNKILVDHFQYSSLLGVDNFPYTCNILATTLVTSNILW